VLIGRDGSVNAVSDETPTAPSIAGITPTVVGGRLQWWVRDVATHPDLVAACAAAGLTETRRVRQVRRPLPVVHTDDVPTVRPFVPGRDNAAWLELNARAFAHHPTQGQLDAPGLDDLLHEPWFDATGFLLHENVAGSLDGFCWTKVHLRPEPLGEIFVIGIDPTAGGTGLGRGLVLAGLDHLATAAGQEQAMLWYDPDNVAAHLLYERLGFVIHHEDAAFERVEVTAAELRA
jgi:mycothiol synthase